MHPSWDSWAGSDDEDDVDERQPVSSVLLIRSSSSTLGSEEEEEEVEVGGDCSPLSSTESGLVGTSTSSAPLVLGEQPPEQHGSMSNVANELELLQSESRRTESRLMLDNMDVDSSS